MLPYRKAVGREYYDIIVYSFHGYIRCLECGNLNYPRRTFCNKRGCGAPRPEGRGE